MAVGITSYLTDMANRTLSAQAGSEDDEGVWVSSGDDPILIKGRPSVRPRMVRDSKGQERVSNVKFTTLSVNNLDEDIYRFTPVDFGNTSASVKAVFIKTAHDENGPHHEVIYLP